jgi:hypothetical protein
MKKLILLSIISLSIYSCKYDYDCACVENGIGAGSKSFTNMKRKDAETQCSIFQASVVNDHPEAYCEIIQNY